MKESTMINNPILTEIEQYIANSAYTPMDSEELHKYVQMTQLADTNSRLEGQKNVDLDTALFSLYVRKKVPAKLRLDILQKFILP